MSVSERKKTEKWEIVEQRIVEGLRDAPTYEGFTVKDLSQRIDIPQPTARWHLELLERSGAVRSTRVGKSKLYRLSKKK